MRSVRSARCAWIVTRREATEAAADLGFPIVLEVRSADILHKSNIGGVRLGVADRFSTEAAFDEILAAAHSRLSLFAAANAATIESLDLNPFLVRPSGALALDAALVTAPSPGTLGGAARWAHIFLDVRVVPSHTFPRNSRTPIPAWAADPMATIRWP